MNSVSDKWSDLWLVAGLRGDPLRWLRQLTQAYSEPHRHYHTLRHVTECLTEFDAVRHLARQPVAVEMAIWFHDAIYDTHAQDNEERSAELAAQCLSEVGANGSLIETVKRLVLSTKSHDAAMDVDAPLMVDMDLSILGQSRERFHEYEIQIRQEYAWVPEAVFAAKRAEILGRFLARERNYATSWFSMKYEEQARGNLQDSVSKLRKGELPRY
jgi:predicted metal-dependent HD superfamily phosphohydrolase